MGAIIQHHLVNAGAYYISERQPALIQAYVGSCVGLALYCRETGIGGMAHLLLSHPRRAELVDNPGKYASTGVPIFLKAILEKGAHRQSLVASLAGGALVAPLRDQDLKFDIGGHTVETIGQILANENIEISHSETGGFFTCSLTLDMSTGRTSIAPIGNIRRMGGGKIVQPGPSEIKKTIEGLKPIPQITLQVLRMLDEDTHGIDVIAEEIRKDQVITAHALKLANSAMFARKKTIETLDHALLYLGRNQLANLILSAAVNGFYNQAAQGYSLCKGGLYYHALGCAQVAEALAAKTEKADPARAFTCGLLHDIGKVVLDQYLAPVYPLFYREIMEDGAHILAVEKKLFGMDHTEAGRQLAHLWGLPAALIDTISHHHTPRRAKDHQQLTAIVYLADLLLSRFQVGVELERIDTSTLLSELDQLDLQAHDLSEVVDLIPAAVFETPSDEMAAA